MESTTHRSGRPSTPTNSKNISTQRNADRERELQQLKSRGVVSVLNKTFDSHDNYVLTPASPPNPSVVSSSANRHSWRKSTSSGTTDLLAKGVTRISTTTNQQQEHMLYDDAPMASPSDIAPTTGPSLRKTQSQDYGAEISARDTLKEGDIGQNDAAWFHIDNHTSLVNQYKRMLQHIYQTENQLLACQLEQQQMENSTRQLLEKSLMQSEDEANKVRQLSTMALKQDQVIHELEFALSSVLSDNERLQQQLNKGELGMDDSSMDANRATQDEVVHMRRELDDLRTNRINYEKRIALLCGDLESSQQETNRLTATIEDINQQCHQQQLHIDEKIENMTRQLAHKDELIRNYQQENRYYSQLMDRSRIRSTVSMDNICARSSIPPPAGPPPSSPLPALPAVGTSTQTNLGRDDTSEHQRKEQHLSHDLTSDDEQDEHVLTPSMEMLLLQAPSTYCLNESALMMDKAHREYTEQLQNRLSINKEIDHLEVWDHAALERLQRQQQLKRASLAPTTTTASSSKWSDRSSLAFESDYDDKQGHSTFWKGMKKKLRV